ncbi:cathepsin d [Plakobranchus ocellatus]|uniref:Cathepsin d n=1 Tax=Plakobranchus ocellatus TaxID=259542 RepID=A0AAV4BWT1_9GAST|nr:cathepsin d [Plakobranchus ocellatus]
MNLSLAAALALALISVCAANLINVPLSQDRRSLWNFKAGVLRRPWKFNVQRLSHPVRPKQSRRPKQPPQASQPFPDDHIAGSVKLTNYKNKVYHLPIEIGTPGQKFNMALHTSYSAMWVPSAHYPFSHRRYNNASSSTYIATGKHFGEYLEAKQGYWSQDSVTVAGATVRNQTFGEVQSAYDLFKDMDIDGVFGLMPIHSDGDEGPTVLENMIIQRRLPIPSFSLYLNRVEVSYRNQVPKAWHGKADLDTSTPLIYGPMKEIKTLHTLLGGTPHEKQRGRFVFDCSKVDSLPDVGFLVNGHSLPLSSKDYVIKEDEDGQVICFSAFTGLHGNEYKTPAWTFGSSFMRAYYIYFDKGSSRLGFAKARH